MGTTESSAFPHRGSGRYVWITLATVAALLVAIGALSVARGDNDTPPPRSFWPLISPVGAEVDPPQNADQITAASDAVVVAHVSGIHDGREQRGVFDPTPPLPGTPLPRTSFVELTVDRVVTGPVTAGQVLTLEMTTPPLPLTLDDARALIPEGQELFFLRNSGTRARQAGFGNVMDPIEDSIWGLSSQKAIVAQGPYGLYEMLDPNGSDLPFLQSFSASTIDEAATHIADTLH